MATEDLAVGGVQSNPMRRTAHAAEWLVHWGGWVGKCTQKSSAHLDEQEPSELQCATKDEQTHEPVRWRKFKLGGLRHTRRPFRKKQKA